jgi:hypothetical protein
MTRKGEVDFVVHGLDIDAAIVRASVFAKKLKTLVNALELADRIANDGIGHRYMISGLSFGSAAVSVREKVRFRKRSKHSGIALMEEAADAIYSRRARLQTLPKPLVQKVGRLSDGVAKQFSHAELAFSDNNVIRIDDFLARQSEAFESPLSEMIDSDSPRLFRGVAIGSFDGVLKEIDARGTMLRGKLILSAGSLEIDCVMNKERIPEARESFDKRVIVEGRAHYDGVEPIPVRLDVHTIRTAKTNADLGRWRGAFLPKTGDSLDEEW